MRRILLLMVSLTLLAVPAMPQGIPFIRNFTSEEYGGHNQNFDVMMGEDGKVFVANFEGLLYYDNSSWHMLHTQGISRITTLFRDSKNTLWTGGYNYIGYVKIADNGKPVLQSVGDIHQFSGEVEWIWEKNGLVYFMNNDKKVYTIRNNQIVWAVGESLPTSGASTYVGKQHINQCQVLDFGMKVLVTDGNGLIITNQKDQELFRITEDNGLCSNSVRYVTYDKNGLIWGATENGIFCIAFPSVFSHFTHNEGLSGEVLSLGKMDGSIYAGTLNGVFRLEGKHFVPVKEIKYACWQMELFKGMLIAATADGIYSISKERGVKHLTTNSTNSLMIDDDGFYSGELDGVYYNNLNGERRIVSDIEKVVKVMKDKDGYIWLQNLYGKLWKGKTGEAFTPIQASAQEELSTLISYNHQVIPVSASATAPYSYPAYSYADNTGLLWMTDNKGKRLYAMNGTEQATEKSHRVYPLMDFPMRAILRDNDLLWTGGDKGVTIIDYLHQDPGMTHKQRLLIRSVTLNDGDSILWGGFGPLPHHLPDLSSHERHVTISFSTDFNSLLLPTQYRTRMDGNAWSAWSRDTYEDYPNLSTGSHYFEVQARDAYGRLSDVISVKLTITPPFYERWYMIVLYGIVLGIIIYLLIQFRLYRLEKEKHHLESIVQERTAEIVKQKDEIEEKSKSLENALQELGEAQHELVRQEKMATVGKLTQGLIDRILNPLNYINNFAKLSQGLVKDVTANVEDEKDHMDSENYEDTMDVLHMLDGNLQKVGEHGASTTRTLKAMEEMLKDRTGGIIQMNLLELLKEDEELLRKFYKKDIEQYHINVAVTKTDSPILINGNPEQLSKTLMSLLGNAVYAVMKQAQRMNENGESYTPSIDVKVQQNPQKTMATITIHDNGVGIESTIIDKVFDPFFTTKTTGEASGIGLYLSREIIQNIGGDISVVSEKGVFTEFTIIIPTLKTNGDGKER